jgi:hypothetical protein
MRTTAFTERAAASAGTEAGASARTVGRVVGALLLAHLLAGLTVPFILLQPALGPPGFLRAAADSPGAIRAAVFLLFAGSAVPIAVAIAAWPVFRRCGSSTALWLGALAVTGFSLQCVDNGALLSMLSLSQAYAGADAARADLFQVVASAVGSARRWAHYTFLLVVGSWILLLCALLYRTRLVPRALAAFGLAGSLLQIAGVTLRALLGYPPETRLAMPLAPAYVGLALWLMVKGLGERKEARPTRTSGAPE